ncbi:hypothetical protein SH591_00700 [Sphingomonas sp. LY54]|uniref:hypothetical protein n=1 Tax=Sphingomonas sp. LY54 TaxID=3095343 RepID=UPI002D77B0B4|nr:hypothetical protein [Sphingomonas sp. LY54]WRP28742.1 hypothetical protein SH591_00700 [Sphingomonas sp. LY54]
MPSDLGPEALQQYLDDLPGLLAEAADDGDEDQEDEDDDEIGESMAWNRVRIPLLIFQQRHALQASGILPLPQKPWDGRKALGIARTIATKAKGWVQPLPDEVAIPILNKAAWFLGTPAEDILRLRDVAEALYNRPPGSHHAGPGMAKSSQETRQRKAARAFQFSVLDGHEAAWHPPIAPTEVDPAHTGLAIRRLVVALQAACSITVMAAGGLRMSELCGLPAGVDPISGLPVCVRIETGSSGLDEVFLCRTLLAKGEDTPIYEDWVIGMRIKGANDLPPAVHALLLLNRLLEPYRVLAQSDRLFVSITSPLGLPKSAQGVGRILGSRLLNDMRDFIENWVDLSQLPDESAHRIKDNDLVEWRETTGRKIRSHQFRKMWASFAYGVDPRLLPALQMQFHHLSQEITSGGYIGKNRHQVAPLQAVRTQQTVLTMFELATGRSLLSGQMGERLEKHILELRERIDGQSTSRAWRETAKFVSKYDLRLWFAPHGKCLPLNPLAMRCHDVAGTTSWLNKQPNYATREPSVCAGCKCFLLDGRHQHFWEDRYIRNLFSYRQAQLDGEETRFRVILGRANQAKVLLSHLGVDVAHLDQIVEDRLGGGAS